MFILYINLNSIATIGHNCPNMSWIFKSLSAATTTANSTAADASAAKKNESLK